MTKTTRRTATKTIGALGIATVLPLPSYAKSSCLNQPVKLGIIADLHGGFAVYAKARLDAFLAAMKKEECDALVQMGDFAYPNKANQQFATKFNDAHENTLHVIGNHEFDHGLTRADCFGKPFGHQPEDIIGRQNDSAGHVRKSFLESL